MKKVDIILIAAPSGAGKNSFMSRALKEFSRLEDIITYTTRSPRFGEKQGDPYHFVSPEEFQAFIEKDFFVEWSVVHDAFYGTSRQSFEKAWGRGKVAILDIDIQGVEKITKIYKNTVTVFILPPSVEELKKRILTRDKKPPANMELRLANAEKEIQMADQYDYQVINDDFEESYGKFRKILEELL